jgi:bifunctional enzyme CysN/CysC
MPSREKSLLRFVTTGSVDDGKSTLIGRLLYESKAIFEDQFAAVERTSRKRGQENADLSLLLDGLSAEREQGITIDVAYRYFETPKRKFIIADTPGHEQYTRNTVTGASTADLAVILIDARKGVLTQSKRHGIILSLLQIPHLVVAVNKMDLVDYSQDVFWDIVATYQEFSSKLDIHHLEFIPVSALKGDNVTTKSSNMPWYDGPTLLHSLENVHVAADRNLLDFRFPVQQVIRPHLDFRGYAGRIASGTISVDEEVVVLPSGVSSRVSTITTYDEELREAFAPQSVVLTLQDEVDVSRGDMIVRKRNLPQVGDHLEALVCWMDVGEMSKEAGYLLKHTTQTVRADVNEVLYRIDVNTLHRESVESLALNDIARVQIKTSTPLFFDNYKANHSTGSFILIDPHTSNTVGAGMIRGPVRTIEQVSADERAKPVQHRSPHTVWSGWNIPRHRREARHGHQAAVLWFTGLSGSGKSTLANELETRLFDRGCQTMLLDGDTLRHGLCGDLGFSAEDRSENIRRVSETARLFFESGHIVLCAFISPFASDRAIARSLIPDGHFVEVYTKCSLEVCTQRDPKGLYQKALKGEIKEFTGISSPYEEPERAEIVAETDVRTVDELIDEMILELMERGIIEE